MPHPSDGHRFIMPLNRLRWYVRWPCKWAAFGIVYFIVCFPYPSLFIRHVRHWSNPNALIEPNAPALQPWVQELRAMPAESDPQAVLKRVQQFVYDHVPYDWDWNTWGLVDYMPTITEVIEMGHEDCDGRAVVAASLLRNLGFNAHIVTDFAHVWVATDYGETMGPGKIKTVEMTDKGLKFQWGGLLELPRATAYGTAVFPIGREIILLLAAWLLLMRTSPRLLLGGFTLSLMLIGLYLVYQEDEPLRSVHSWVVISLMVESWLFFLYVFRADALALTGAFGGLLLVRYGAVNYPYHRLWAEFAGAALMLASLALMFVAARRTAPSMPRSLEPAADRVR